jgi:esterase/lipase
MTAAIWRKASLERWSEHTARYRQAVLVGYSMGGAAAIQMAARTTPGLLVLIAPFARINDRRAILLPLAKRVVKEFRLLADLDYEDPEVRQWFKAALPGLDINDPEIVRRVKEETGIAAPVIDELRKFGNQARREAPTVSSPVVVVQGHQDTVVHPRHTRQLIDQFQNLVAYHEVPGDHLLTLDTVASWPTVRDLVLGEVTRAFPAR